MVALTTWDPRSQLNVPSHCKDVNRQCAATDKGYFCTARAGHPNWHAAYGQDPSKGTLHIWYVEGVL